MTFLRYSGPDHTDQFVSTNGRRAERIWTPTSPLNSSLENILLKICNINRFEKCGFIDAEEKIWPIANVHNEPSHNFLMDEESFRHIVSQIYDEKESRILGVWHTHPTNVPWPSPRDLVGWPNPALGWRYWIITNSEVIEWKLVTDSGNL